MKVLISETYSNVTHVTCLRQVKGLYIFGFLLIKILLRRIYQALFKLFAVLGCSEQFYTFGI